MQTDPIGYGGGANLYAYVLNDPVNFIDPLGLQIVVTGHRRPKVPTEPTFPEPVATIAVPNLPLAGEAAPEDEIVVTGRRITRSLLHVAAGALYIGPSFCPNARIGRANRFFPIGRIVSGKEGGFNVALNDLDRIAKANDLSPLGSAGAAEVIAGQAGASWFPFPVGDGWWVTKNMYSGDISTWNRGLTFRLNPPVNKINIDIPRGFKLPDGRSLQMPETCHYVEP